MLNMRKRPYSDISSSYGGVEDQVSARAGSDADLNPPGPNGMTSMPQGGPADLKFLLELPLACMTKDVRAAVQKAATASGKHTECPFLGVRRKQRYSSAHVWHKLYSCYWSWYANYAVMAVLLNLHSMQPSQYR